MKSVDAAATNTIVSHPDNYGSDNNNNDIVYTMIAILSTLLAIVLGLIMVQKPIIQPSQGNNNNKEIRRNVVGHYLPDPIIQPSKRSYEIYVACYTPIWICIFGCIVYFQLYEQFNEYSYLYVCGGLCIPLLLQPIILPSGFLSNSPDQYRSIIQRYSFKANVWIAMYSFIGNYWYTHYFYSVLKASYTMPAHRFNNVPIAMFLATHFYFTTYHFFSNCMLRKICTSYQPGTIRTILFISVIIVFSYFTAFMETLSISSFPYYTFEDRYMAYTVGSAFYGIYFLVSFPAFYYFDNDIDAISTKQVTGKWTKISSSTDQNNNNIIKVVTLWDTIVSSCGYGMMILFLLDFVRLALDIPLVVGTSSLQCVQH